MSPKNARSTLAEKIRKAAVHDRRSPLYLWMLANYQDFSATVAEAGRPNWKALAVTFAEEGLLDLKDRAPTPESARLTWFKVRQAKNKRSGGRPPPGQLSTTGQSNAKTATVQAQPYTDLAGPDTDDDAPKIRLRNVTKQP